MGESISFTSKPFIERAEEAKQAMDGIVQSLENIETICKNIGAKTASEDSALGETWRSLAEPLRAVENRYDETFRYMKERIDDYVSRTIGNEVTTANAASELKSRIADISSSIK